MVGRLSEYLDKTHILNEKKKEKETAKISSGYILAMRTTDHCCPGKVFFLKRPPLLRNTSVRAGVPEGKLPEFPDKKKKKKKKTEKKKRGKHTHTQPTLLSRSQFENSSACASKPDTRNQADRLLLCCALQQITEMNIPMSVLNFSKLSAFVSSLETFQTVKNLKQNESQSACAASTNKGVN